MGFKCANQERRKRRCKQSDLIAKIKVEHRNLKIIYRKLYLANIRFLMASPRLTRKR